MIVLQLFSFQRISIHALREEGDPPACRWMSDGNNFYPRPPRGGRLVAQKSCGHIGVISIHALREEGDAVDPIYGFIEHIFLSTPSARRATVAPTSVCAVWPKISIHALREEGDQTPARKKLFAKNFYPRPP